MQLIDLRKNMRNILIAVSGLDAKKVYWANQNMPKVRPPLLTLQLSGFTKVAAEEMRYTETDGVYAVVTPTEAVLSLQYFEQSGHFAADFLEWLQQELVRPTIVDACHVAGFSFFAAESVIDVTALLGNGQEYEPRASLDLHVRYASVTLDKPGYIQSVLGTATTHQEGEPPILTTDFSIET